MELSRLIPNNNPNWFVKKGVLTFKKFQHIPLLMKEDDFYYIFLDLKLRKEVINLVVHLRRLKLKFYFVLPTYSSPKGVIDFENKNISHYLFCYIDPTFHDLLIKCNFDLIQNLVNWSEEFNIYHLIKPNYDIIKEVLNNKSYNPWSNVYYNSYPKEIIEDYNSLYRQIQINKLLN